MKPLSPPRGSGKRVRAAALANNDYAQKRHQEPSRRRSKQVPGRDGAHTALNLTGDARIEPTTPAESPALPDFDGPDTRYIMTVFRLVELDGEPPVLPTAILPASAGFAVLHCWQWHGLRHAEYPIVGWQVSEVGVLPLVFGPCLRFYRMHSVAVRAPSGLVTSFEGDTFANVKAWLRDRRTKLRGMQS